jgi:thiol-disulfide isomerase/thioredoxin
MKAFFLLALALSSLVSAEARTWTDAASGRTLEGDFVRMDAGQVVVRRADGIEVRIALNKLSPTDQEFVQSQAQTAPPAASAPPKPNHKKGELLKEGDVIDLSFKPVNGAKVDLAAMKDKVVLLDFWATWCGPCVGELPNVKAAYAEYHAKGFEVVGISLDSDRGQLKDFIKENEMPWPQYFDGKGWDNDLAKEYGVRSIPAAYLIKNSTVIATEVRGPALQMKLKELIP